MNIDIASSTLTLLIVLLIWDGIWRGIGLWHAARNRQIVWFVCILICNTVGILPIIYLVFFRKKTLQQSTQ